MTTHEDYIRIAGSDYIETENQILSIDKESLPQCAIDVLRGEDGTEEYWDFLIDQLESRIDS